MIKQHADYIFIEKLNRMSKDGIEASKAGRKLADTFQALKDTKTK